MRMPFFISVTHQLQASRQKQTKTVPVSIALLMASILTGCQTTNLPSPTTDINPQVTTAQDGSSTTTKPSRVTISTPADKSSQTQQTNQETSEADPFEQLEPSTTAPATFERPDTEKPSSQPTPTAPTRPDPVLIPPMPKPDAKTAQQLLLEQARQNSRQGRSTATSIQDGSNLPAFQKLMDTGVRQMRQGQLNAAQSTFTRAQRLAPQSSAVYFYLSQIALKQNQPLKAEAMARRGLVVAQTSDRKKALWQLILMSAEAQGNTRVINEAKAALGR